MSRSIHNGVRRSLRRSFGSSAFVAVLSLLVAGTPVAASGWSTPKQLATFRGVSSPSMALHAGKLYIAVASDGIRLLTNRSGRWRQSRITRNHDGQNHDFRPSIAVAADGDVHIVFSRSIPPQDCADCSDVRIFHATDAGGSWVARQVARGLHASIALTPSGSPRIAYSRGGLHFARPSAGGWTSELVDRNCCELPTDSKIGGRQENRVSLAIDAAGRPSVAYQRPDAPSDIAVSRKARGVWSTRQVAAFTDATAPDLALDANGDRHIAFRRSNGTWYATDAAGSSWAVEKATPQRRWWPSIAVIDDRTVAIVVESRDGIHFRTNRTGTFEGGLITTTRADSDPDVVVGPAGKARVVFARGSFFQSQAWLIRQQ